MDDGHLAGRSDLAGDEELLLTSLRIFTAWSDEPWINEGAAVRVSLVCFGMDKGQTRLDGQPVAIIHADLTAGVLNETALDMTQASKLPENVGVSFQGPVLVGAFDVSIEHARPWLTMPNPNGLSNSEVLRPLTNGKDITSRTRGLWVIDFGMMAEAEACLYEQPFEYVRQYVKPLRDNNPRINRREKWWIHGETGVGWRRAIEGLSRYIATTRVAKHRTFIWVETICWPSDAVVGIARADDATFGILHSRFHELWSLRLCTWLGKGNDPRYTPTTTFETFPFPAGLTPADTRPVGAQPCFDPAQHGSGRRLAVSGVERAEAPPAGPSAPPSTPLTGLRTGLSPGVALRHRSGQAEGARLPQLPVLADLSRLSHAKAIAQAAFDLNRLREAWLNPPVWVDWVITPEEEHAGFPRRPVAKPGHEANLKQRTLTNLYNIRPAWLAMAHEKLDQAVASAYGWDDYTPDMADEDILRRLLALNRERNP